MGLTIKKIICSCCEKEHLTKDFIFTGNFGYDDFKQNQVYLHDVGGLELECECGYRTTIEKSFRFRR